MKRIVKMLGVALTILLVFTSNVRASSYNFNTSKENLKLKPGESFEFEINLSDIDMNENGINIVEGYIDYDNDVIEELKIIDENGWSTLYNNDKSSNLYGKFLILKNESNIIENQNIAKVIVKIKDKVKEENSLITFKNITSNDGEKLINTQEKSVVLQFDKEDVSIVNTGDIIPIVVALILLGLIVLNLLISKRKMEE